MTNRKPQIVVTADTTQARDELNKLKESGQKLGEKLEESGKQAQKPWNELPNKIKESAPEVEKADSRIIASIQRRTAAIQAAGKGELAYQEQLLKNRGQNVDLYKPYLDQLKQAEAAQKLASGSLDSMGLSAKQTAAALRGVPAQFTDIVTALQGGQQPLTVFLQQGGQLKDMFGGAGNAARALGGYVVGLINPFTLAAAGAGALALGYYKGAQEAQEFNKTLILSGNQAGLAASQFTALAASVSAISGGSIGRSSDAITMLATSGVRGAENMRAFAAAAVELERVGGPAIDKTAQAFAELAKSPYDASVKLNEAMNYLSSAMLQQIKSLQDQGRAVEAADMAQRAYADAIKDRTPAILENLGDIERAWLAIKKVGNEAVDKLLSVGRPGSIDGLRKEIEDAEARLVSFGGKRLEREKQILAEKRAQLAALLQGAGYEAVSAYQQAQAAEQRRAANEWLKESERYLSSQQKLELEILRIRNLGVKAGMQEVEIERLIAAARAAAQKGKAGDPFAADRAAAQEWAKFYLQFADNVAEAEGKLGKLTKTQTELVKFLQSPAYQNMDEPARQLALSQAYAAITAEQMGEAQKEAAKIAADAAREYKRWINEIEKGADSAAQQADKLRTEEEAARLAAAGYGSLAQAIEIVTIKRLQEKQVAMMGDEAAVLAIQKEIDVRRELIGLIGNKEARDAAKKAADKAADDWKKAADKIEDAITDSLMRGFESGKGFAENLRDTVENMFKTMVLRPVISAIVQPVAQQLTGSLGLANAASGVGAYAGLGSMVSGFGNLIGSSGVSAFGAGLGMTSAQSAAAASAYSSAGMGGTASAIGAGSSVATAIPYLAAAYAIYSIAKSLDDSGTIHTGASSQYSAAAGLSTGMGVYGVGSKAGSYGIETESLTTQITQSIVGILDSTASTFGKQVGYAAAAGFADDTSKDGAWGSLSIKIGEKIVEGFGADGNGRWPGQSFSDGQAGTQEYLAAVSADVRNALEQIGLPDWASGMLDRLGDAPSLDQLAATVAQINATQAALVSMGEVMPQLSGLTESAVNSLLASFGSIDGIAQSAQSYYENFYSQAERSARTTEQVGEALDKLGLSMPATREAYRSLVEAQDLTTEAGQKTYAALLKLSPAFASVVAETQALTDAVDETAAAIAKAAEEMAEAGRRALASLAEDQGSLLVQLLNAQGNGAEASALERQQALARITAGLSETDKAAATAAYDYNQALRDQITALLAATDAQKSAEAAAKQAADAAIAQAQARAQAIASEGYGLETRLLQAQGNTAELRRRELEALDPTNRKYLEQIFALEDKTAAEQAATAAAQEAARAAEAAASAQQRAAEEAERAAERIRDAWQSVADSLYDEVARIRGLVQQDSGASYASMAARFGITTAQARAGDQEAAKLLPSLSQTMLTLAEAQATSLAELQRIRAQTAASLESTGSILASQFGLTIPKLDTGTNYVPRDMLAVIHKGEAVVPAAYNPASSGGSNAELVAEIRGLREENKVQALRLVQLSAELNRVVKTWDASGLPTERVEA